MPPRSRSTALFAGFEEIAAHHQGVLEHSLVFDAGSYAKHTVVNAAGLKHRTLADDRLGDLSIEQLAGGK